jgi:aldose 1-epimerase
MEYELAAGDARIRIDPSTGGRVTSIEVGGLELLVARTEESMAWGPYPMAPWAGRVRYGRFSFEGVVHQLPVTLGPHAIHGTSYLRAWQHDGEGRLSVDLGPDWPFAGRAVQEIAIDEEGVDLRLEVHAQRGRFPASIGWHPWFRRSLERGAPAELAFRAGRMHERDEEQIPTGALVDPPAGPWDDCFTEVERSPKITWPGALELSLSSDVDCWVVYDEPVHALCIEPLTAPPDALNSGAFIVTPDKPLVATVRLSWKELGEFA